MASATPAGSMAVPSIIFALQNLVLMSIRFSACSRSMMSYRVDEKPALTMADAIQLMCNPIEHLDIWKVYGAPSLTMDHTDGSRKPGDKDQFQV